MRLFSILRLLSYLATAKDHRIVAVIITIIVIVLSLYVVILVSILGVGTIRKIRYINFVYHLIMQYSLIDERRLTQGSIQCLCHRNICQKMEDKIIIRKLSSD